MGAYRINGNLAVSRAFGDRLERPFVSSVPEVRKFNVDADNDHFIILASDGMWDVMTSKQAVEFVRLILAGSVSSLAEGQPRGSRGWGLRPIDTPLHKWMRDYSDDSGMLKAVNVREKQKWRNTSSKSACVGHQRQSLCSSCGFGDHWLKRWQYCCDADVCGC